MSLEVRLHHPLDAFTLDVAFSAPSGVTALFGRSGAGKSTVVNAVAGLLKPRSGHISVNGTTLLDTDTRHAVPVHKRQIGYVFQEGRLFPHLTVRQNLGYGRWFARRRPHTAARTMSANVDRVVGMLGIGHLLDRRPAGLSGGEKQRVAIGRALLSEPQLLLLDEPLAALDEARKGEILPYLERLRDETQIPILYVSHSVQEVARLATTIIALQDGTVVSAGPTAQMLSDPTAFPLFGRQEAGAIVIGRINAHDSADGLTEITLGGGPLLLPKIDAPIGTMVRLRIRARDVTLALRPPRDVSVLNALPVRIAEIAEGPGPIVDLALLCGEDRLLARITKRSLRTLGLVSGLSCYALLKTVAVSRRDIGTFDEPLG